MKVLLSSTASGGTLDEIQGSVRARLRGMLQGFVLSADQEGLVLRGRTRTYYAKQLAQQLVMESTDMPIHANDIEVR